jgi:hypothetical protein
MSPSQQRRKWRYLAIALAARHPAKHSLSRSRGAWAIPEPVTGGAARPTQTGASGPAHGTPAAICTMVPISGTERNRFWMAAKIGFQKQPKKQ